MRLTIDLDKKKHNELMSVISKVIWHSRKYSDKIKVEIEETKRGYHIISYGLEIDFSKSMDIRRKCSEDKNRLKLDAIKKKFLKQILFNKKKFLKKKIAVVK